MTQTFNKHPFSSSIHNVNKRTDGCQRKHSLLQTPRGPWGLTAAPHPLIRAVLTLGFPSYYGHTVGGHVRSFTQAQRSLTVVRLLSIHISKLVPVILPEANRSYFVVFPSSFSKPYILQLCGHSPASCLLSPASKAPRNLLGSPVLSQIHFPE